MGLQSVLRRIGLYCYERLKGALSRVKGLQGGVLKDEYEYVIEGDVWGGEKNQGKLLKEKGAKGLWNHRAEEWLGRMEQTVPRSPELSALKR